MNSEQLSVAVVILTFNEESNIDDCLDSVEGWAKEIFVVDSYSTDRTVGRLLSRKDPALTVIQHQFKGYSAQWNWALEKLPIKAAWTLKLDADERLTPEFKTEVRQLLEGASPSLEGVLFRRRCIFLRKRLGRVGTLWYDLRLWRSGCAHFDDNAVNEHAHVRGDTIRVSSMVDHCDNKSITEWLDKHNRYASLMAMGYIENNYKNEIRASLFGNPIERTKFFEKIYRSMPFRPMCMFLYLFIARAGFVDGRVGFHYCLLRAIFFHMIDLKILEARLTGREPEVIQPLRGQPDARLTVVPGI